MQVTVYTKNGCQTCTSAKLLLQSKNIQYTELVLDSDFTRENLQELFPYAKSFPVIVVDGMNIGGYDQLSLMIEEQSQDKRKFLNEGSTL